MYTTIEKLKGRIDQSILASLADDYNSPPDINSPEAVQVVEQAISDGAAMVDSYVLGRVDPNTCAQALERANATLALYFLYRRRYLDDSLNPLALSKGAVVLHLSEVAAGRTQLSEDTPDA